MFPVSVRMDEEHVESLRMVLESAKADRTTVERWRSQVTQRQALAIDDVEEVISRAEAANRLSDRQTAPLLSMIGRRKPW